LTNPLRELPPLEGLSILKKPYIITIGRFLELIACVNLVTLVYHYFRNRDREEVVSFVKKTVLISFLLILINVIIYLLVIRGLLSGSQVVYITSSNYYRLKGWFIEGGPYGLMMSFIFVLSFFYKSKYNLIIRLFLIFTIVLFTKSKAGILLLVLWGVILYNKIIYKKIKSLRWVALLIGAVIALFVLFKLGEVYLEHSRNMEKYVSERPDDTNLIMGRIAGSHIVPRMVVDNPILGIGLGNYPIERNVQKYRGFIPYSPPGKTDAHGLGGIVQLLVDGGLLILVLFFALVLGIIKNTLKSKDNLEYYLFAFVCFFMAGVQIYFLYPWFLLAIVLVLNKKSKIPGKNEQ
jgi:O-antigen ligase